MPDITTISADVSAKVPSRFWIHDAAGYPSVTVTLLVIAFIVTTLAFVSSIFVSVGHLSFRPFDVNACTAYFIPILTLYFGRKWTDAKYGPTVGQVDPPDDGTPMGVAKK